MNLSRTSRLAVVAVVCALASAPAALAGATHHTPVSHRTTHNALTTGAWTPMIDESRVDPPFNRLLDYADALARFENRP